MDETIYFTMTRTVKNPPQIPESTKWLCKWCFGINFEIKPWEMVREAQQRTNSNWHTCKKCIDVESEFIP
jgi:hypothetical protein